MVTTKRKYFQLYLVECSSSNQICGLIWEIFSQNYPNSGRKILSETVQVKQYLTWNGRKERNWEHTLLHMQVVDIVYVPPLSLLALSARSMKYTKKPGGEYTFKWFCYYPGE